MTRLPSTYATLSIDWTICNCVAGRYTEAVGTLLGFAASLVFLYQWYCDKRDETTTVIARGGHLASQTAQNSSHQSLLPVREDSVEEHVEGELGQVVTHRRLHCCAIFLSSWCTTDFQQYLW